ncbi:hypothetical protein D3C71_1088020 [compost metagenome]
MLGGADRVVGLRVQQAAVGQAGEVVVEGQATDAVARFFAFQRERAQMHDHFDQSAVEAVRVMRFAVVERERAEHAAIAGLDRRGPARG